MNPFFNLKKYFIFLFFLFYYYLAKPKEPLNLTDPGSYKPNVNTTQPSEPIGKPLPTGLPTIKEDGKKRKPRKSRNKKS
jgi:hypothetical protein